MRSKTLAYRRGHRSVSLLFARLVAVTKYRRKVLTDAMVADLETLRRANPLTELGGELIECKARPTIVHVLLLHGLKSGRCWLLLVRVAAT